jgi:hypothetical protein
MTEKDIANGTNGVRMSCEVEKKISRASYTDNIQLIVRNGQTPSNLHVLRFESNQDCNGSLDG